MPSDLPSLLLAAVSALFMGFSKTGLPGASIPSVALMAAAFSENVALSVGAMLPLLLAGDVFAVSRYHRDAQWGRLLSLFPYVVLGMVPGYFVLAHWSDNQLRPILGWLILAMFLLQVGHRRFQWTTLLEHRWFTGVAGFLAGFATIVGNAGGPVMTLYLLSRGLVKEHFVGTCAWFFFLLNLTKVVPFWHRGILNPQTLTFGLSMAPVAVAGGLVGVWMLPRVPQKVFDLLVSLLAGIAGLWLIVGQSLPLLLAR